MSIELNRSKKTKMSLTDHLKNADDLAIARKHLIQVFMRTEGHHNVSSKLMKMLNKLCPSQSKPWSEILNILDEEFYLEAKEEQQFEDLGFIYYKLDDRYKTLVEKGLISQELSDQEGCK